MHPSVSASTVKFGTRRQIRHHDVVKTMFFEHANENLVWFWPAHRHLNSFSASTCTTFDQPIPAPHSLRPAPRHLKRNLPELYRAYLGDLLLARPRFWSSGRPAWFLRAQTIHRKSPKSESSRVLRNRIIHFCIFHSLPFFFYLSSFHFFGLSLATSLAFCFCFLLLHLAFSLKARHRWNGLFDCWRWTAKIDRVWSNLCSCLGTDTVTFTWRRTSEDWSTAEEGTWCIIWFGEISSKFDQETWKLQKSWEDCGLLIHYHTRKEKNETLKNATTNFGQKHIENIAH